MRVSSSLRRLLTILTLFTILLLTAVAYGTGMSRGHGWGDDFAAYIDQARSLVDGNVLEMLERANFRDAWSTVMIGPVIYPWGFPLILAPVYQFWGLDITAMKLAVTGCFVLSLVPTYFVFRTTLKIPEALLLTLGVASLPIFMVEKDNILSDVPFTLFTIGAVWCIDRLVRSIETNPLQLFFGVTLGLLMGLAFITRTIGFVLLLTLISAQTLTFRRHLSTRRVVYSVILQITPYAVFILLVLFSRATLPTSVTETNQLNYGSAEHIWQVLVTSTIPYYTSLFCGLLYVGTSPFACLVALFFPVVGIISSIKNTYVYVLFSAAYMSIILLWPYLQGYRFIYPIIPLFLYFWYLGIRATCHLAFGFFGRHISHFVAYAIAISLVLNYSTLAARAWADMRGVQIDGPFSDDARAMFEYVERATPVTAVVNFFKPRALMLLTDRQSVYETGTQAVNGIADHVVLYKYDPNQDFYKALGDVSAASQFTKLFENESFVVLRRERPR